MYRTRQAVASLQALTPLAHAGESHFYQCRVMVQGGLKNPTPLWPTQMLLSKARHWFNLLLGPTKCILLETSVLLNFHVDQYTEFCLNHRLVQMKL